MRFMRSAALCLAAATAVVAWVGPAFSAATLQREYLFGPDRVTVERKGDETQVRVLGGIADVRPGRPDLPWVSETVQLPPGQRVARVEVVSVETEHVANGVSIPPTVSVGHGMGPFPRTVAEPEFFTRPGYQPEQVAALGVQGWQGGQGVATLRLAPARWDPVTRELARVSRVVVRLHLEAETRQPLVRERIVDWDDPTLTPARTTPRASMESGDSRNVGFAATQLPSVLGSPVQYVIITSDELVPQFQRLADWKTASGVPAVVRTMSFIRQNYVQGSDDVERVRDFIRDAYTRWGTQWVLLGGDTDLIPTRMARTSYFGGENIPCDMYFSCLDGNWDADGDHLFGEGDYGEFDPGDSVDFFPEVFVGRAPVLSLADAQRFVDKTFQYTRTPVGDYEHQAIFFAEVLFPINWVPGGGIQLDGAQLVEELLPSVDDNPAIRTTRFYENDTCSYCRPGHLYETRQAVLDSLNLGYNLAVHVGHGYRNEMSVNDGKIVNNDVLAMTNGNRLSNLYAINCTSNAIDFPCIGEAFLHAPNGGAVTNVGSTRLDFPYAGRFFEKEFFRLLFEDSLTAIGELQAKQKLPMVIYSVDDNPYRWMQFTLLLLGDPELRVWTGPPRTLSVTHASGMALHDTSLAFHVEVGGAPLANARVTMYRAGHEFVSALTNASGNVSLPVRPDSLGTIGVVVTGYDCRPYQGNVTVGVSPLPVVVDGSAILDDDAVGGTDGDGDGFWDAGEVLDLKVPLINRGGTTATSVVATISTTDPMVTVVTPSVNYGTMVPSVTVTPAGAFRLSIPASTPDQREISLKLTIVDGASHSYTQTLQLTARAPELHHFGHTLVDAGGPVNGHPDPGETLTYTVRLRNLGTADAHGVTAVLRVLSGAATVTDSTATYGNVPAGAEGTGDALVATVGNLAAKLQLRVSDEHGLQFVQTIDLVYPTEPFIISALGRATSVQLTWYKSEDPDYLGYNVYRSVTSGGPFTKVNAVPTNRIAVYEDTNLPALTRFFYQVTVVDSSGNESVRSTEKSVSTNPPSHTVFPIETGASTFAPVTVDHLYPGVPMDLVAGSDVLYVWHADGTAPIDADGTGTTPGDFTRRGTSWIGGASLADIDNDGIKEVIGVTADSMTVFVFDLNGNYKPGWPRTVHHAVWSSVAVGDLNNDGFMELAFGSNGDKFYVFRHNGTEWIDGDSNPSTQGVFKLLGNFYNFGTPSIADLDGNGIKDIIFGGFDARLYAWRPDGSNLPGFPKILPNAVSASTAVGYLDGPSDTQLDIVVLTGSLTTATGPDSLYAFTATGVKRPGFPRFVRSSNNTKAPSPALADMNNDGFLDIVAASTNGRMYVYDRNGSIVPPWNGILYSTAIVGSSEASPVVADIDGDGMNDVVMGDETGNLTAISGTGNILPGFPIKLDAEVKAAAALCDCDGDGMTEIAVAGWDKKVYFWDYDFPFSPNGPPAWPQYHHDAYHTGLYSHPVFVDVELPQAPGGEVRALQLAVPQPNPTRRGTRFQWSVPADRVGSSLELSVYDLAGREVRTLERGTAKAGRRSSDWDLRNGSGQRVGPGVYFVRLTVGSDAHSQKFVVIE